MSGGGRSGIAYKTRWPHCHFDAVFRPQYPNEKNTREHPVSEKKLVSPLIMKVVLGLLLHNEAFIIFIPREMAAAWQNEINQILRNGCIRESDITPLVGSLNHIRKILPNGRYFLNRFYKIMARCERFGKQLIRSAKGEDLKLWLLFLDISRKRGISINNITCTKPDMVTWKES